MLYICLQQFLFLFIIDNEFNFKLRVPPTTYFSNHEQRVKSLDLHL